MRLRDTMERIKYGGLREFRTIVAETRDAVLTGKGRFVLAGIAVLMVLAAVVILVRPSNEYKINNQPAVIAAQQDREALMRMTPQQLGDEEKRRAAAAAAAGDDDADFATEALERARFVREAKTRSLSPVTGSP